MYVLFISKSVLYKKSNNILKYSAYTLNEFYSFIDYLHIEYQFSMI